jgi:hypothetical protein
VVLGSNLKVLKCSTTFLKEVFPRNYLRQEKNGVSYRAVSCPKKWKKTQNMDSREK